MRINFVTMAFYLVMSNLSYAGNAFVVDPVKAVTNERTCMQLNLYHEARGEDLKGIAAVMAVTMGRVRSPDFPNTICDVVWQFNQFEWTDNEQDDNYITDVIGWNRVTNVIDKEGKVDFKESVLYYHSGRTVPRWFAKAKLVEEDRIGSHIFYRSP